ncbi:low molecular weight protein-tyrosine-phosphatase [Hydrogenophaga sp.]|uniref:low molecular weight protein-tyrosine-phosphatase n=1 Tax=Hydrogenophaga sp. TaxID=1904254 RepID=UPI00286E4563|nr:low molecular weight protein-tyrosine-phosphatase [Hydrogenophaga sp.]
MIQQVLVICTGNICRSPLAAALLAREMPHLRVLSAGLDALVGQPADPLAIQVGAAHGLDLSGHRARNTGAVNCHQSQLLLVMTRGQKTETEQRYPLTRGKVYLLRHQSRAEVADPYRKPLHVFEAAYADIERGVQAWCHTLRQLR